MREGITVEVSAADRARLEAVVADRNSPQRRWCMDATRIRLYQRLSQNSGFKKSELNQYFRISMHQRRVTANGAYDGEPSDAAVATRQADPLPDVVIPPRATAALSRAASTKPTRRDCHIQLIRENGRMAWQKATGYGRRSLVEAGIGRYKSSIGPKLRARTPPNQRGEAAVGIEVLNRMIRMARPISVRIR